MTSFQKLWENSQNKKLGRDFWTGSSEKADPVLDDSAKQMVLRGLEMRPEREDGQTFWDDFLDLIGQNAEGASKLLGVASDVIARWPKTIRNIIDKVKDENDNEDNDKNMISTGIK
jgi:hypothetical protein